MGCPIFAKKFAINPIILGLIIMLPDVWYGFAA